MNRREKLLYTGAFRESVLKSAGLYYVNLIFTLGYMISRGRLQRDHVVNLTKSDIIVKYELAQI